MESATSGPRMLRTNVHVYRMKCQHNLARRLHGRTVDGIAEFPSHKCPARAEGNAARERPCRLLLRVQPRPSTPKLHPNPAPQFLFALSEANIKIFPRHTSYNTCTHGSMHQGRILGELQAPETWPHSFESCNFPAKQIN